MTPEFACVEQAIRYNLFGNPVGEKVMRSLIIVCAFVLTAALSEIGRAHV